MLVTNAPLNIVRQGASMTTVNQVKSNLASARESLKAMIPMSKELSILSKPVGLGGTELESTVRGGRMLNAFCS